LRSTASLAETRKIRLHRFLFPQNRKRFPENPRRPQVGRHDDSVVHPFAFASRSYDAHASKVREMPRNLGLALPENLDEVADAHFPSVHEVQKPQTSAIRERRK
jgi:hypothetical protein